MPRGDRLRALHLRFDGPIPEVLTERASFDSDPDWQAARRAARVAELGRHIVVTARAMSARLRRGRADQATLRESAAIGLAADMARYLRDYLALKGAPIRR